MAFFAQSAISFAVSLTVTITGIGYLHDSRWVRASSRSACSTS